MKSIRLQDIVEFLGDHVIRVYGDLDRKISYPVPLKAPGEAGTISFCKVSFPDAISHIESSKVETIICREAEKFDSEFESGRTLIAVDNPRLAFIRVVNKFFTLPAPSGIHPTAVVDPSARVAGSAYVGPMTYVGPNCIIGEHSVIYGRVYLYNNVTIGSNVIIHAGAVIGADGFGFERTESGEFDKFPHLGGVVLEDDVEIGANTCIDRGTLADTIIKARSKVDNLVHIAHNVVVEEDCAVIAHAMVAGSVQVGRGSWVAPCASIRESIKIGEKSLIGLGAVVVSDVPNGTTVMGAPAREIREYKTLLNAQKELMKKV